VGPVVALEKPGKIAIFRAWAPPRGEVPNFPEDVFGAGKTES
jgi:hypothetical protein